MSPPKVGPKPVVVKNAPPPPPPPPPAAAPDLAKTIGKLFGFPDLSTFAAAAKKPTKGEVTQGKIDAYFDKSKTSYTLPDGSTVRALPHFRMNEGDDGAKYQETLTRKLNPKDAAMKRAIHMVAYGRASPDEIKKVTQALIDKGGVEETKLLWSKEAVEQISPNTKFPLSDADAVRLMQWDNGVGVDCAGYVQQEFLAVHGGARADWGFDARIGDENLASLKGNKHFQNVKPADAQVGDLMILDKPPGERVGHTVMVQDVHAMTDAERAKFPGIEKLAKKGEPVRVFVVEASFGSGGQGDPARGGVQRRVFLLNEATGQWGDMRRDWSTKSDPKVVLSNNSGPYDHPMNGIFHPKGK